MAQVAMAAQFRKFSVVMAAIALGVFYLVFFLSV
jgi:hypothetical protein